MLVIVGAWENCTLMVQTRRDAVYSTRLASLLATCFQHFSTMPVSSNDVQRLFLQAILSRRILSQKLAAKIWEKCIDAVKGAPFSHRGVVALGTPSMLTSALCILSSRE